MTEELCYCRKKLITLWNDRFYIARPEKFIPPEKQHKLRNNEIILVSLCPIFDYIKNKKAEDEEVIEIVFKKCMEIVFYLIEDFSTSPELNTDKRFNWCMETMKLQIEGYIRKYDSSLNPDFIYSIFERWMHQIREMKEINYYDFTLMDRNELYNQYR